MAMHILLVLEKLAEGGDALLAVAEAALACWFAKSCRGLMTKLSVRL